jgi:type IV pilus assembly protein PilA
MREVLRKRLADRTDEGFTLIELMVVVLIIAILLAIAIPTFLGARQKAQDRAAQSDARNALTAAKTFYVDNQVYADSTDATFTGIEPSLTFVGTFPTTFAAHNVWVLTGNTTATDKQSVCIAVLSASGKMYEVQDIATGANAGTYFATVSAAPTACDGTTKLGGGTGKW